MTGIGIDEAITQVERLYQGITGKPPPSSETPYAPIPAEKDPARQVEEELDRLLSMLGPQGIPAQMAPLWTPPLSVWESPSEILFCLDLPGIRRDQVEVQVQGNALVVSGSRAAPVQNGHQLRVAESPVGKFRRVLMLSHGLRPTGPSAQLKDGVLEIRVPREASQPLRSENIPVT